MTGMKSDSVNPDLALLEKQDFIKKTQSNYFPTSNDNILCRQYHPRVGHGGFHAVHACKLDSRNTCDSILAADIESALFTVQLDRGRPALDPAGRCPFRVWGDDKSFHFGGDDENTPPHRYRARINQPGRPGFPLEGRFDLRGSGHSNCSIPIT